jgi:hypothetical protein
VKRANGKIEDEESSDDENVLTEYHDEDDPGAKCAAIKMPILSRETIVAMVESHYCAHPDIPGMAMPDTAGIWTWAVKKMYEYCKDSEW